LPKCVTCGHPVTCDEGFARADHHRFMCQMCCEVEA
jgi:hypothetical protein